MELGSTLLRADCENQVNRGVMERLWQQHVPTKVPGADLAPLAIHDPPVKYLHAFTANGRQPNAVGGIYRRLFTAFAPFWFLTASATK